MVNYYFLLILAIESPASRFQWKSELYCLISITCDIILLLQWIPQKIYYLTKGREEELVSGGQDTFY